MGYNGPAPDRAFRPIRHASAPPPIPATAAPPPRKTVGSINGKPSGPRPQVTPGGRIVALNGKPTAAQNRAFDDFMNETFGSAPADEKEDMGSPGPRPECKPRPAPLKPMNGPPPFLRERMEEIRSRPRVTAGHVQCPACQCLNIDEANFCRECRHQLVAEIPQSRLPQFS